MQQIIEGLLLVSPEVHTENIILAFNQDLSCHNKAAG